MIKVEKNGFCRKYLQTQFHSRPFWINCRNVYTVCILYAVTGDISLVKELLNGVTEDC